MDKNYKETILELEEKIKELSKSGISIQSLNSSVEQLKKHTENVEKIEENIEAIREEVIDKIKDELQYNKKAGSFSIYGFWVGSIALLMSVFSIGKGLIASSSERSNNLPINANTIIKQEKVLLEKIDDMKYKIDELIFNSVGFSNNHKVDSTEFMLEVTYNGSNKTKVVSDSLFSIEIAALSVKEIKEGKSIIPTATLCFFANDKKIGKKGISEIFKVKGTKHWKYNPNYGGPIVKEKDTIKLFLDNFIVEKIYMKESEARRVADDKNAVLLKKLTSVNYDSIKKAN